MRARRMFGGWGIYADDVFVAVIIGDRLHLKTSESTRERFAAAGCEPFVYHGGGKTVTMSFWTAPPDALESPALMAPWARLALQAALAARAAAPVPRRRRAPAQTAAARKPLRA
jgi:DNA transformation protein and related proteins